MNCQILFSKKNEKSVSKCRLLTLLPSKLSVNGITLPQYFPMSTNNVCFHGEIIHNSVVISPYIRHNSFVISPCRGVSNEYPRYMLSWRNKKYIKTVCLKLPSYLELCIYQHLFQYVAAFNRNIQSCISQCHIQPWLWLELADHSVLYTICIFRETVNIFFYYICLFGAFLVNLTSTAGKP